jgi:quinoprotein glucose dehydrogenase
MHVNKYHIGIYKMIPLLLLGTVVCGCAQLAGSKGDEVEAGLYSKSQAERGRTVYVAKCATCHMEGLTGRPPAPALRGSGFMGKWQGQSVRALYSRIRTTMPNNAPGSLSRAETLDLVAFLFKANGLPPGAQELAGTAAELQQITIRRDVEE